MNVCLCVCVFFFFVLFCFLFVVGSVQKLANCVKEPLLISPSESMATAAATIMTIIIIKSAMKSIRTQVNFLK